jgi:hypothetical protein
MEQIFGRDHPRGPQCHGGASQHICAQVTGSVEQYNHARRSCHS